MNTDKEFQTKLDNKECNAVDDYTIGFATYLMQKQHDKVDRLQVEIKRLEKENEQLRAKLRSRLTCNFVRTAQKHVVQKFAEKLKEVIHERDYVRGYAEMGLIEEIDELLEEYK